MPRRSSAILLGCTILMGAPALSSDISQMIAENGLAGARQALANAPATENDGSQGMARAAVSFLSAIEEAYQTRWKVGLTDPVSPMPMMATELPPNPAPTPISGDLANDIAASLIERMKEVRTHLPDDAAPDAELVLRFDDIWLDVNMDSARQPEESLTHLFALPPVEDPFKPATEGNQDGDPVDAAQSYEIRFDRSDIAWLRAYSHLIEGISDVVLAFDPAPELTETIAMRNAFAQMRDAASHRDPELSGQPASIWDDEQDMVDYLAVILKTLAHDPNPSLITSAADHFAQMIAANREFWAEVGKETDDDREWIPNDNQSAALPIQLPKGTGDRWLRVLDEFEATLNGARVIPHWRVAEGFGINLSSWIAQPSGIDAVGWIQGVDALAYVTEGQAVTGDSLSDFQELVGGNALPLVIMLN